MFIIGITGPTGAGKTIAMHALDKQGALTLDCDEIYHELLTTNTQMTDEIAARFPDAVTNAIVDRKKLGKIVFNDNSALTDLNNITHKYIHSEVDRRIGAYEKQGGGIVIVNAIALIEFGYSKKCNIVVCITAPLETRIARIMARDGLTRKEILDRINAQKPDEFYAKNADYVLENTHDNAEEFLEICRRAFLIDKWFYEHIDEMIADLGKLVGINSVRGKSEDGAPYGRAPREALQTGQDMLEAHGFEVSVFKDMVITASIGANPPKLGILAHLDIVEAGEHWDTDPFVLTNREGRLFGRGVMDNKGPAVASMYAAYCVCEIFPELSHGVQLIFGSGEETGFDDIAQYAASNTLPPNVFSPDADFPVVNVEKGRLMCTFGAKWDKDVNTPRIISIHGGKTPNIVPNYATAVIEGICEADAAFYCTEYTKKTGVELSVNASRCKNADDNTDATPDTTLTITAKGTAAHASKPEIGKNAQTALIAMLAAMPFAKSKGFGYIQALARLFPHGDYYGNAIGLSAQDEISGRTTVNFGVLRYDELEFSAGFDARTAICADKTDLLEQARDTLKREGIMISYHELKQSHHTPKETEFVQTLLRAYEQYAKEPGDCISLGGLTYVHGIPGGVAFGCTMPDEDNNIHGANEYIDVKQLVMCAKIFARVIMEMCI